MTSSRSSTEREYRGGDETPKYTDTIALTEHKGSKCKHRGHRSEKNEPKNRPDTNTRHNNSAPSEISPPHLPNRLSNMDTSNGPHWFPHSHPNPQKAGYWSAALLFEGHWRHCPKGRPLRSIITELAQDAQMEIVMEGWHAYSLSGVPERYWMCQELTRYARFDEKALLLQLRSIVRELKRRSPGHYAKEEKVLI